MYLSKKIIYQNFLFNWKFSLSSFLIIFQIFLFSDCDGHTDRKCYTITILTAITDLSTDYS